jgi:hypothetical protein
MKPLYLFYLAIALLGCQKSEVVTSFTGNEATYALQPGSAYAVTGTIVFKERKDGQVTAVVQLTGTDGDSKLPVHLHLGDISKPGQDIALLLNPVMASTGKSETTFNKLSDESTIDYSKLSSLLACIKIHRGETGADRDIILAAGNIGAAVAQPASNGRAGVAVCKSE